MTFRGKVISMIPSRGINNVPGDQNIADGEVVAAQNVRFSNADVAQRGGFSRVVNMPIDGTTATGGTVAVTNGSTTVTGTGTTFVAGMVGGGFIKTGDTASYRITAVASTTSLTLASAYTGTTSSGSAYTIRHTGNPVTGQFHAKFSSGTTLFIAMAGSAMVKATSDNSDWTSIKGALTSTSLATNLFSFCILNDLVIGTNGVDALWKFSDSNDPATAIGGTPPSKALAVATFQNRVLAVNVTNAAGKGKVQWCTLNNPDDWTSSGSGSATPILNGAQELRGIGIVGNEGFIFYERAIFRIYPTGDAKSPFGFPDHAANIGALSPQSIVAVEDRGIIFFAGQLGIYKMEAPSYLPVRISERIDTTWNSINKSRMRYIVANRHPVFQEVWFSVSNDGATTHALILIYDYDRDTWTTAVGPNANWLGTYVDSDGETRLCHGDYNGRVFVNESGTSDDGSTIDAYVSSKAYPLVDGYRRGRVPFVNLHLASQTTDTSQIEFNYGYTPGTMNAFTTVDQFVGGAEYDSAVFDVDTFVEDSQITVRKDITGQGAYFQWQVRQRVLDNSFRLYGLELGVIGEGRQGE